MIRICQILISGNATQTDKTFICKL